MRRGRAERLSGSLSHLPSLASKSSHALLSPLSTHATGDVEKEGNLVGLRDLAEVSLGEGGGALHDALDSSGKELLVLDLSLQVSEGGILGEVHHEGVIDTANKDLHGDR